MSKITIKKILIVGFIISDVEASFFTRSPFHSDRIREDYGVP